MFSDGTLGLLILGLLRRLEQRSYCNESPEELLTPVATARENQGWRSSHKSTCPSEIGKMAPVEHRDWLSVQAFPVRSAASLAFRPPVDTRCRATGATEESGAEPCSFMDRKATTSHVF